MELDREEIKKQAEEEFKKELFQEAVESYKKKLREKKSVWDKIFPWRVSIIVVRKGVKND